MKLKIIYIMFTAQLLINPIAYADTEVSDCAEVAIFRPIGPESSGLAALRISNHNGKLMYPRSYIYQLEPGIHTFMVDAYNHIDGGPSIGSFEIDLKVEAGKRYNLGASLNGHTISRQSKKFNARVVSVKDVECIKKEHRVVYEAKYKEIDLDFSNTVNLPQNLQVEFELLVDEIQAYYADQGLFFDGLEFGDKKRQWPNIGFGFAIKNIDMKKRIVVTSVQGEEAKLLGLQEKDELLSLNSTELKNPTANLISSLYEKLEPEQAYQLRVKRNGKEVILNGVYRPMTAAGYVLSISPHFNANYLAI